MRKLWRRIVRSFTMTNETQVFYAFFFSCLNGLAYEQGIAQGDRNRIWWVYVIILAFWPSIVLIANFFAPENKDPDPPESLDDEGKRELYAQIDEMT